MEKEEIALQSRREQDNESLLLTHVYLCKWRHTIDSCYFKWSYSSYDDYRLGIIVWFWLIGVIVLLVDLVVICQLNLKEH